MVELLAPAGSREAFLAAVENGANAVYLAGDMFGARAYASNFDRDALREVTEYAHRRQVRINVTVNTIVDDEELPALRDYLRFLDEIGVDAILVQDLGVARLARETVPNLPLHASTQMTVHSLEGVLALQELGFTRVVLAREMSMAEIREICQKADVEIEVFMHGALCVCYSGQCLMSSMIGGRSGNRGRCAQSCRLPYTLVDASGNDALGDKAGEYLLSPRDFNTIDAIPDLLEAGVASLKIEGRMKKPEYVAVVVRTYREAIDRCYAQGAKNYASTETERDHLAQIFNRDFTTAYLYGKPGKAMMSDRRPNNRGLLAGRVTEYNRDLRQVSVKLARPLAEGDQIVFWVKVGGRVTATIADMTSKNGKAVKQAAAGETVTFSISGTVHPHDRVFKVYDAKLMQEARESYTAAEAARRTPVDAVVTADVGSPLVITYLDDDGHVASAATNFIGETARKRPLSRESVEKQIARLGGTPFELRHLDCELGENVMVPVSEINDARRRAVEMLDRQRLREMQRAKGQVSVKSVSAIPVQKSAECMVSVESIEQARTALEAGADGILFGGESYHHRVIPAEDYRKVWNLAKKYHARIDFNTPRIVRGSEQPALETLLKAWEEFPPDAVHVHNIGTMALVRRQGNFPIHADYSLISYNKLTLDFLRDYGASEATLSPELTLAQIAELQSQTDLPLTCIVNGRLELMVSEYCVMGSFLGGVGEGLCSMPCVKGSYALKDRKDYTFPLVTDQFCRMHILNSKVLSMLPYAAKLRDDGIALRIEGKSYTKDELRHWTSAFRHALVMKRTDTEEAQEIIAAYEGRDITRGHFFRKVL